MDDCTNGMYGMFLGKDILTSLELNLKFYKHIIREYYEPLKGSPSLMVDLGAYEFKDLNTGKITPKE